MQSKIVAFIFASIFAILAAAAPNKPTTTVTITAAPTATTISQCPTGDAQCCNTTETAGSTPGALLLGLLGIVVQDLNLLIGVNCVSIVGTNCAQQPVCCTDNQFNGLVNIGCTPISL